MDIELLHGREIAAHAKAPAALRIRVFRELPCLYDGSPAYEAEYLQTYISIRPGVCACWCAMAPRSWAHLRHCHLPMEQPSFWQRRGYHHAPDMRTEYVWRDIGALRETGQAAVVLAQEAGLNGGLRRSTRA